MRPDAHFVGQSQQFWAYVRSLSERLGYTVRGAKTIRVSTLPEMMRGLTALSLDADHLYDRQADTPTVLGDMLAAYFAYRAVAINSHARPRLMNADEAESVYEHQMSLLSPTRPPPMNKQRGDKARPAYLTGLVNMVIEAHSEGLPCNYSPTALTTFTRDGRPLRTLARRVDGCFPLAGDRISADLLIC